jgi:hypothetical protein
MAVVLIVEDEAPLRVLAESIIRDRGHTTLSASTLEQAIALLDGDQTVELLFTAICSAIERLTRIGRPPQPCRAQPRRLVQQMAHKKSPKRTGLGLRSCCLRLAVKPQRLSLRPGFLRQSRDLGEPRPSSWINTTTMRVFPGASVLIRLVRLLTLGSRSQQK